MDNYSYDSVWGASLHRLRERGLAPISGVQGTGLSAAAALPFTTGMTGAVSNDDVRVPPRGRPL